MNKMQQYEAEKIAASPMTVAEMMAIRNARKLGTYKAVPEPGMVGKVKNWFEKKTDVNAARAETSAVKGELEQANKDIAAKDLHAEYLQRQSEGNKVKGFVGGTAVGVGGMIAHSMLRPKPNYIPHALAGGAALGLGTGMALSHKKNEQQQY